MTPKTKEIMSSSNKSCFVIAPIGEAGTPTRERSDKIFNHIIKPVVQAAGYVVKRADQIDCPGTITPQILYQITNDDLVIADLTDHNPNVFYELAIRHGIRKPFIQIIQKDQTLPFDVKDHRTIFVDHTDLDSVYNCKEAMREQIEFLQKYPEKIDYPLSKAINLESTMQKDSGDSVSMDDLFLLIKNLTLDIQDLKAEQSSLLRRTKLDEKYKELNFGSISRSRTSDLMNRQDNGFNEAYYTKSDSPQSLIEGIKNL